MVHELLHCLPHLRSHMAMDGKSSALSCVDGTEALLKHARSRTPASLFTCHCSLCWMTCCSVGPTCPCSCACRRKQQVLCELQP